VAETRVCRTCGQEKPLTREEWPGWQRAWGWYTPPDCRPCFNAARRLKADEIARRQAVRWEREYRAIEKRSSLSLIRDRPIPHADPYLDLEVIDACWQDCVNEGLPAITRMVKKLAATCWCLPNADRLSHAAVGYLNGENSLAMVRDQLDSYVGLARTA
jgi:hypothetical protein